MKKKAELMGSIVRLADRFDRDGLGEYASVLDSVLVKVAQVGGDPNAVVTPVVASPVPDPNAPPADPNAMAMPQDPNAMPVDPNAVPQQPDPNAMAMPQTPAPQTGGELNKTEKQKVTGIVEKLQPIMKELNELDN